MAKTHHHLLNKDAEFVLQISAETRALQAATLLNQLNGVVRGLRGPTSNVRVQQCGLALYTYDLSCIPKEFVIVDEDASSVNSTRQRNPEPFNFSDSSIVAKALQKASFKCTAISDNTSVPPVNASGLSHSSSTSDFVCSPVLSVDGDMPFILSLPNPSCMLLAEHFKVEFTTHSLKVLVDLVILWTRSWGLAEFTHTVLALMIEHFLHKLKAERAKSSQGNNSEQIDISQTMRRPGSLLSRFLKHFSSLEMIARSEVITVPSTKREAPFGTVSSKQYVEGKATQPASWRSDCMVVTDPLIKVHNHAQHISLDSMRKFASLCDSSHKLLVSSSMLLSIFGPHLRTPERGPWAVTGLLELARPMVNQGTQLSAKQVLTLRRVRNTIIGQFGSRYRVELFGSARYGTSTPMSDLDLVIIDPDRMTGFAPNVNLKKLPSVYDVREIARTLRRTGFEKVFAIPTASVPIVKFKDGQTGVDCDINVNDQLGMINSDMLGRYCDICPVLRPMIALIKRWAKPLKLNNPSGLAGGATFSSYALMLMTIAFLQSRNIVPNLQEHLPPLPENPQDDVFWVKTRKGDRILCDIRFMQDNRLPFDYDNDIPPEDLVLEWFNYWGVEFVYDETVVDVKRGGMFYRPKVKAPPKKAKKNKGKGKDKGASNEIPIASSSQVTLDGADQSMAEDTDLLVSEDMAVEDHPEHQDEEEAPPEEDNEASSLSNGNQPMCVWDPFIRGKNITGNIRLENVRRFQQECKRAVRMLESGASMNDLSPESGLDSDSDGGIRRQKMAGKRKQRNVREREKNRANTQSNQRQTPRTGQTKSYQSQQSSSNPTIAPEVLSVRRSQSSAPGRGSHHRRRDGRIENHAS